MVMKESMTDGKPFLVKPLDNGIVLSFFDLSRRIAGDRWFVKLSCEARLPVPADFFAEGIVPDPGVDAEIRRQIGSTLIFLLLKERNFIADELRQTTLESLIARLTDNILSYVARPDFPRKLFRREYERLQQVVEIKRQMGKIKPADDDDDDEEGPADFSACFK